MPNQTHCSHCRRELTPLQIRKGRRCCSNDCKRALHYANGYATFDAMSEPYTDAEVAACNRMVAEGKARLRLPVVMKQTPADDSPLAERRLREVLVGCGEGLE